MKAGIQKILILFLLKNKLPLECAWRICKNKEWFRNYITTIHLLGHILRWIITNPWTFFKTKLWDVLYVITIQLHLEYWSCTLNIGRVSLHTISLINGITTMMKTCRIWTFYFIKCFFRRCNNHGPKIFTWSWAQ
jgi:hypothetical protein